jgi:hypothetical protein
VSSGNDESIAKTATSQTYIFKPGFKQSPDAPIVAMAVNNENSMMNARGNKGMHPTRLRAFSGQ